MQIIKYIMLFFILASCSLIGRYLAKKYVIRVIDLEEMKNALNMFKAKIKFTYQPMPEVFEEISQNTAEGVKEIFILAKEKMNKMPASKAWEEAVEETRTGFTKEDKYVIKTLSKLLGQTDIEGQISQIEITEKFLETQLKQAQEEKNKNEKLYSKLGTTIGLAIVIILC